MHLRITCNIWVSTLVALTFMKSEETSAANILAMFPIASRSHNNIYSAITLELARKGHSLTVVTPLPMDSPPPNYEQIDVSMVMKDRLITLGMTKKIAGTQILLMIKNMSTEACTDSYKHPKVREFMKPPKTENKFNLILASSVFIECMYGFAHVHKAPIVVISPTVVQSEINNAIGNIVLPSVVASPFLGINDRMTFIQRLENTLLTIGLSLLNYIYFSRNMEHELRQGFGEPLPPISDLEKYISLVVTNTHLSVNGPHSTVPNLIEAGGLHVKKPKELPQNLKSFLDGAGDEGAIYFSLGSIMKSENLPVETVDAFVATFAQLKQRVLWKWEGKTPIQGLPDNVLLEKWLPQQDVLAHPNVKLFITHGGLLSFQEASSRGVPVIGIPFYGDQFMNMNRVIDLGVGMKLDAENLTTENILGAVKQILEDPKYAANMKRIKSIVNDQSEHPLDRAIYWIEYVIRHKGAEHLKTAATELKWYQIYLLDVLIVLVTVPFSIFLISLYIMRLIWKKCCQRKKSNDISQKKKKQ